VNVTVNGVTVKPSDFWELETSPVRVIIMDITDRTIRDITAQVNITNEGSVWEEYPYEFCIVSEEDNQCGGGDDEAYGSGSERINAGESWITYMTLNIENTGDYWFKVVVYWGTEKSGSSRTFTAIAAPEEVVTPAPGPGVPVGVGKINISEYPAIATIEQGELDFYSIIVENYGDGDLNNVKLEVEGIPSDWYSVIPLRVDEIGAQNTQAFVLKIKIPVDAQTKIYHLDLTASSDEDQDSVSMTLSVVPVEVVEVIRISDIQILTPEIYLNQEGKIIVSIENTGGEELNVTCSLILPEGWSMVTEEEITKIIQPRSNATLEFMVLPTTAGLNNLTLIGSYDGRQFSKEILVSVEVPSVPPILPLPIIPLGLLFVIFGGAAFATTIVVVVYRRDRERKAKKSRIEEKLKKVRRAIEDSRKEISMEKRKEELIKELLDIEELRKMLRERLEKKKVSTR
jgi:hypothetical protein